MIVMRLMLNATYGAVSGNELLTQRHVKVQTRIEINVRMMLRLDIVCCFFLMHSCNAPEFVLTRDSEIC